MVKYTRKGIILLLKVVGQIDALDDVLPELPESPYLIRKEDKKHNVFATKKIIYND